MLSRMKIWKKNDGADIEQSKQIDFTERKKEKSLVYFSEDGFDCCCWLSSHFCSFTWIIDLHRWSRFSCATCILKERFRINEILFLIENTFCDELGRSSVWFDVAESVSRLTEVSWLVVDFDVGIFLVSLGFCCFALGFWDSRFFEDLFPPYSFAFDRF